jgi:hypothetical protein
MGSIEEEGEETAGSMEGDELRAHEDGGPEYGGREEVVVVEE